MRVGRRYLVRLQPEPEGGYTVTCPSFPGLVSYGSDLGKAVAMAADAVEGHVACLIEDGCAVPPNDTGRAGRLLKAVRVAHPP